jgi:hypothetical protein
MFEPQTVTIKSGEGINRFEAEVTIATSLDDSQARVIMDSIIKMQSDRMLWAERQK